MVSSTTCPWVILLAGTKYIVFHLQKILDEEKCYNCFFVSDVYPTFTLPPIPCLSSILIALLLSDNTSIAYTPSSVITVPKRFIPPRATWVGDRNPEQSMRDASFVSQSSSTGTVTGIPSEFTRPNVSHPRAFSNRASTNLYVTFNKQDLCHILSR